MQINTYNEHIIGTCSLCGGPVVIPTGPYWSVIPPTPYCRNCGATQRENYGPIIPMNPPIKCPAFIWTANHNLSMSTLEFATKI